MSSLRVESLRLCWLEAFVTVAKTENISEAARQLGVSQPTISRHLIALTQWCGYDLIDTRAISDPDDPSLSVGITTKGQAFYENANNVLEILRSYRTDDAVISELLKNINWMLDRMDSVIHSNVSEFITEYCPSSVAHTRQLLRSFYISPSIEMIEAIHRITRGVFHRFELDFDPISRKKYKEYVKNRNGKAKPISAKEIRI